MPSVQLTLLDRKPSTAAPVVGAFGNLADADNLSLVVLAAAAAQGGGSRDSRVRRQRLLSIDPH
jgi:hypothetical protein